MGHGRPARGLAAMPLVVSPVKRCSASASREIIITIIIIIITAQGHPKGGRECGLVAREAAEPVTDSDVIMTKERARPRVNSFLAHIAAKVRPVGISGATLCSRPACTLL